MSKFENFIYTNDVAISEEICEELINYTNDNLDTIKEIQEHNKFLTKDLQPEKRSDYKLKMQDDFNYFWAPYSLCKPPQPLVIKVIEVIMEGLSEYITKYPAMVVTTQHGITFQDIKYHIVKSGGGYHSWHSEWDAKSPYEKRILAWHISLTSHENEGELEFLYHDDRIPAKAGRLIIWPAFFPWVHRGNAIRTDTEKHYLTGWFWLQ